MLGLRLDIFTHPSFSTDVVWHVEPLQHFWFIFFSIWSIERDNVNWIYSAKYFLNITKFGMWQHCITAYYGKISECLNTEDCYCPKYIYLLYSTLYLQNFIEYINIGTWSKTCNINLQQWSFSSVFIAYICVCVYIQMHHGEKLPLGKTAIQLHPAVTFSIAVRCGYLLLVVGVYQRQVSKLNMRCCNIFFWSSSIVNGPVMY